MSEVQTVDWYTRPLSSLGTYENGFAFNDQHWSEHGLPIVRIAQITGTQNVVDRYPGVLPKSFRLNSGDLIFSWSGTLTVVRWQGGPAWLNQHLFKVTPAANVDPSFLFHVLKASVEEFNKRSHGSTMKHIKRGELDEYIVNLPVSVTEQSKIAEILDTLDEAIRGTEAVVAKLKAMKQGLLHDLLTRGIDANGDLRPPVHEAPHLYHETPLGWLPKGWRVERLEKHLIGNPKNGYSPQDVGRDTGVKMLGLGCLTKDGFAPNQIKNAPSSVLTHQSRLSDGDLLISRSNTMAMVGRVGRYRDIGFPCIYPDLMMRLIPATTYLPEALELLLRSRATRRQIENSAVGTSGSMVKINSASVRALLVPVVPKDEQVSILVALESSNKRLEAETRMLAKLRLQKSGLMDDLLTGRVSVTPLL